ncbi:MAG TPA: hypothetical protein VEF53_10920, partial [Patescibacteria group bacterium]|nr:hypothetical protein [Patescibacteria group bacterium]
MSNHMRDEDALGKAFDLRLMKRLLKYAKPFTAVIALCVMLLMLITATELLRPKLIQIAIDDYIKGVNVPLIAYDQKPPYKNVEFQGKYFVREKDITDKATIQEKSIYQIIDFNNNYFLYQGRLNVDSEEIEITKDDCTYYIMQDDFVDVVQPIT